MLHKAIASGKEHRKPWTGAKAVDYSCHNHKSCPWCYGTRMYKTNKKIIAVKQEEKEYGTYTANDR